MWGQTWEPINGRVIATEITGHRWPYKHKYVIEYSVDGGEPQRIELKQAMGLSNPRMISPFDGSEVPLLINRTSGKVRFDVKNPAINFKAQRKAFQAEHKSQYDKALHQAVEPATPRPPDTPPPPPPPPPLEPGR